MEDGRSRPRQHPISSNNQHHRPAHERQQQLLALFIVGLCAGVVIAERLYIRSSRAALLSQAKAITAGQQDVSSGGQVKPAGATVQSKQLERKFMGSSTFTASVDTSSLVSTAAAAGALAAQVAAAEAAAVAGISKQLVRADPQLRELDAYLQKIAPTKEVLVGVSNINPLREGMLDTFLWSVKQAGVKNYLIVALDQETAADLTARGYNAFYMPIQVSRSQADTGSNHAISALKFGIIKKFLQLGWAVLLSDIDVCVLQDPFKFLYRDHDVEGMTDGFDASTAYGQIEGYEDPSMGWSRFAQKESHFNLNSGLFFISSNMRTIELMERLEKRLSREKYWDQTAYNEEMFFLSHGNYKSPKITVRVMNYYQFMNSKVLFKDVRHKPAGTTPMPVMVHINYHPDKHERMKAVLRYYVQKDMQALAPFPGGSEPGT